MSYNTIQDVAAALQRVEIGCEADNLDLLTACRKNNWLIVYGASDDLCKFTGAFSEEVSIYDGGEIRFTARGAIPDMDQVGEALAILEEQGINLHLSDFTRELLSIEAIWDEPTNETPPRRPSWHYITSLPHATFDVMESGALYCIGLVIDLGRRAA